MLHVVTNLACQVAGTLARLAFHWLDNPPMLGVLVGFMFLASLVAGTVSLLLLPVVLKLRSVRPPTGILVVAIGLGVMPWMTLLIRYL